MKRSLIDQTRDYLESKKGSWPTVAREAGLDKEWIYAFMRRRMADPGVLKLEAVLAVADKEGWIDPALNKKAPDQTIAA